MSLRIFMHCGAVHVCVVYLCVVLTRLKYGTPPSHTITFKSKPSD
jgi:hypothetical protein